MVPFSSGWISLPENASVSQAITAAVHEPPPEKAAARAGTAARAIHITTVTVTAFRMMSLSPSILTVTLAVHDLDGIVSVRGRISLRYVS